MTSFLTQHFDILKRLVLTGSDFKNISPSDCKTLSLQIYKKTNQQVSETTLKRVYGFAYSKFKPSLFTLDAMAKYCDYYGWADFCESNGSKTKTTSTKDVCWEKIKQNADKITSFTLQALKNRSGIPYNQTIKRKFIDDHFDAFLKDGYTATVFTAPAGYGKTISLCHWVEERLSMNAVGANNDIILFFSSNALINVFISGKDINEWLLSLLGYGNGEDFSTLLDIKQKHEGNFYLVIDGLDEHMFKGDQFQMLLNQVVDIFSFYEYHDNFKLILTMRSASWINNRYELEDFKDKCFLGFPIREDVLTNVPLFSNQEIKELSKKINPLAQNNVSIEVAENFNHPLYFQFYYKQHKENFSFNDVDHVCIYEVISTFILNKIYLGPHAAEKSLFVKLLIEYMDLSNGKFEVSKFKINDQIKQYHHAYNDLLAIGFIRELNKSGDMQYNATITFSNDNFLNYTIARHLLYHNNNTFDLSFVLNLNNQFKHERKLAVLKWTIIYAVRNGQHDICEFLAEVGLNPKEKAELITFLGDLIVKEYSALTKTEALNEYFQNDCSDHLFNYAFGVEFINADYKKALNALLTFKLSNKKKILVYTGLAIIAVIQLDINKLEGYLSNLKSFSQEDLQSLAINPLSCLETIYYFFKYGIVKKEAFTELTRFYFNPPKSGDTVKGNSENDILYLLAVYTLSICKNPVKLLRFTKALKKVYIRPETNADAYNFTLNLMVTEAYIQSEKMQEATQLYNEISKVYDSQNQAYTPFMLSSFYLLKLNMSLSNNQKTCVHELMKPLVYLTEEWDFKLTKIQGLIYILKNKFLHENDTDFYKRSYYDFIKVVRESGFREESFIDSEAIMAIK
jgi:hypothetical protein